jgi:aryl-alcohol dehydrogenase-like predicted oxidoreductase
VRDDLRHLGLEALDIANYRLMGGPGHGLSEGSIYEQVTVLAKLQKEGFIRHNRPEQCYRDTQVAEAQAIAKIRMCAKQLQPGAPRRRPAD